MALESRRRVSAWSAAILSAQGSKWAKPLSRRKILRSSSQKQRLVVRSRKARSWLTMRAAARLARNSASRVSMAKMSRWLVGSSSSSTSGFSAKARASAARRPSPPERPWVERPGSRPKSCSAASASWGAAPPEVAKSSRVSPLISGSWATNTTLRPGVRNRSPPSASRRPESTRSRVDLPAPLRPTRQARAPGSRARSTPSNSMRGPSARRTSFRAIRGARAFRAGDPRTCHRRCSWARTEPVSALPWPGPGRHQIWAAWSRRTERRRVAGPSGPWRCGRSRW